MSPSKINGNSKDHVEEKQTNKQIKLWSSVTKVIVVVYHSLNVSFSYTC